MAPDNIAHLTPLYDRWMAQMLEGSIPQETKATCSHCTMCDDNQTLSSIAARQRFSPDTKCCTYWPRLPNFLLGSVLRCPDTVNGQARLKELISERPETCTPLGMVPTLEYEVLYQHTSDQEFGRSSRLRCPFYDPDEGGICTIWGHRNGVCATWHCKYVRGDVGRLFWSALKSLFSHIERSVSIWCVTQIGVSEQCLQVIAERDTGLSQANKATLGRTLDSAHCAKRMDDVWGAWKDQKPQFYMRASELTESLAWNDVISISGAEGQALANLVKQSYRGLLSDTLPSRLSLGRYSIYSMDAHGVAASSYSAFDPLRLSRRLLNVLERFDGSQTADVLTHLREKGTEIDPELLRTLVDFRILVRSSEDPSDCSSTVEKARDVTGI